MQQKYHSRKMVICSRLFDHKYPWITLSNLTSSYSIGVDHDKVATDISLLSSDMNSILSTTLGYYGAAMESTNLYVRTILLVSCACSLIKGIHQITRDLKIEDVKMGLDKIRRNMNVNDDDFHNLICTIFKYRSRPAHGNIDIESEPIQMGFLTEDYELFHQMVREYILDFIDSNQDNSIAVPKI
jgi:hypothetical protein